jgi:TetR/AcrR family transcriptional repressor of lmrAB and yxaGH operons
MRAVFERKDTIPLIAEVFRELGYEGASFSRITERTGVSKGSLYHFFPGGKEEMAAEILAHIDAWFEANVFAPLGRDDPRQAIANMWRAVLDYFHSGRRVCLVGVFALDETRDLFGQRIHDYFQRWIKALAQALVRAGMNRKQAQDLAEECVASIQGGLVISRAMGDTDLFVRTVRRLARRLDAELA